MLACQNVSAGYGSRMLFQEFNWIIRRGECWAILGQNGTGKSTLLHLLAGLMAPHAGQITLDKRALNTYPRRELAQKIGLLLQEEINGFWGNVMEYVSLGRYPYVSRMMGGPTMQAQRAIIPRLAQMDLLDVTNRPVNVLSGGERQRARIALLLAQEPELYLFDEPLQHLDLRHQLQTLRLLRSLADQGKAVVMVLHDVLSASRFCDHALLLYAEGIVRAGESASVLTRPNLEHLYQCELQIARIGPERVLLPGTAALGLG